MKITAKARYALRIMLDVAVYGNRKPRTIKEIARSQSISEKFISRIVVPLRRAGFLDSVRGVQGGLRLARPADEVTVLDIVEAMEGPVSLLDCLSRPRACKRSGRCPAEDVWRQVNEGLSAAMRAVKLSDVVARYRQASLGDPDGPEYSI